MNNRKLRTILIVLCGCIVLYAFLGFVVLAMVLEPVLKEQLSSLLRCDVAIADIDTNPFALSLSVEGLDMRETGGGGPLFSCDEIYINFQLISAFKRALVFRDVRIVDPLVTVRRDETGRINCMALAGGEASGEEHPGQPPEETGDSGGAPPTVSVALFEIVNGTVDLADAAVDTVFATRLRPLDVRVVNLSTAPGTVAACSITVTSEIGETISLRGEITPTPLAVAGTVELKNFSPGKYAPYYDEYVLFSIPEGLLDISTDLRHGTSGTVLDNIDASLRGLRLVRSGEEAEFLTIPGFSLRNGTVNVEEKRIRIGSISSRDGSIVIRRCADGVINVAALVPPSEQPVATGETPREPEQAWLFSTEEIDLKGYAVTFEDRTLEEPFSLVLENISLDIGGLSTEAESRATASLDVAVRGGGRLSTRGTLAISPPAADIGISLEELPVRLAQPYLSEATNIIASEGTFATEGRFVFGSSPSSAGQPAVTYRGNFELSDLVTLDGIGKDELFKARSLALRNLDLGLNPNYLSIEDISLSDFFSRLIINEDQSMNVTNIVKRQSPAPETAAVPEEKEEKTAFFEKIFIGGITLSQGSINFTDHYITPDYTATLSGIEGSVSGISSIEERPADISLRGSLDTTVPLEIAGTISPLQENLFADLTVLFENVNLSSLTPYSGRYLGRTIEKGKLFLNLKYLIDQRTIESQNKILVDQFTLGERVDSPDAVNLPVDLALSLLRDRKGVIDLDVPVSGSIDDPDFSVGYFIIKIITNIIEKAVTSPFSLLGGLVGGGEELGYAEFQPGSTLLADDMKKKLDRLSEALFERPGLSLEIEGHVDIDADRNTLKKQNLEQEIRSRWGEEYPSREQQAPAADDVPIPPEEREQVLTLLYQETVPSSGGSATPDAAQMEAALLEAVVVPDDELRNLAHERAAAVQTFLLETGRVEKERIFLVEPKSLAPEKRDGVKDSRVDFTVR
ncbi:MAG: DUF748 domain-containing protein [Deltaproteobacteria bacterium]|nr:DUF748 domain-containing protein [Deltaproteobacteria bacterium]